MKKSDLRSGMWVQTSEKENYLVLLNTTYSTGVIVRDSSWLALSSYDDNLKINDRNNQEFDIIKVFKPDTYQMTIESYAVKNLVWERSDKVKITCEGKSVEISRESAKALKLI